MTTSSDLPVAALPDIDWVEIPGGDYIYQDGKSRTLPTFYMARHPITNMRYQAFLDACGYDDERWWQGIERATPQEPRWPQATRPRTSVNWYEAVAFGRWSSEQLSYTVRLPTEEEWERAARGRAGRTFPWGDDYSTGYANIDETWDDAGECKLEQTTIVGAYPLGTSSEGVLDLAGNVCEWCLNKHEHPEEIEPDTSGDARVLRGGSWDGDADAVRSAERNWNDPGERVDNVGFRLVSSGPIR
ncbi:MAG: SUMF1/EgtB/PvdO family nonheme iron enzyme [Candidatus Accumulibacter sp.]|uniref:formylglycine-generating enzyme family protein n=1 Tax=Accumulibacter sp. TaxID=2053492 RepID=UPI0019E94000|nr:SUMF1/EgtB/PvdO family nonheme iron enzyme [Accumulibacter sp.]MBE2260813.1 SUMF1/EgtB/PvdO family nonheme iron enzyme [Paracoccaceae bacterium]MCB1942805.1 SUMF1/EgtB/PvdO family nonheme iron enzyme [Accumulibacter sp.]MCP5247255.1 SUMF1/EgtB/PvdO family nonheme iron enzyme [Accumulibacter sp.]